MLVFDLEPTNIELAAAHAFTGQVALDRGYPLTGKLQATQLREVALCPFQERHSVDMRLRLCMVFWLVVLQVSIKFTDEDLPGQGCLNHPSQFDCDIANDEIMHGRIEALGLVKLIATADMKTGTQPRYRFRGRLAYQLLFLML